MTRQAILPLALALFSVVSGWSVDPAIAAAAGTDPTAALPDPAATTAEPASPPLQLILDRRQRLLKVMEGDRERRRFRVGVGMPGWETPVGSFSVIEKTAYPVWEHPAKGVRIPPGPANPLGSRWIGFHRDCKGRRGFNGQEHLEVKGCVSSGFHGTPHRDSVGAAVSHGCVRLFDEDVRELFEMVQLGTPVTVLP
ncbi:L,D-transpeptidase [Synechococcus sp. BA-120 BA3]|nr:L,D-transpeptidase [Synechococcus sp. BA-120 BA3]